MDSIHAKRIYSSIIRTKIMNRVSNMQIMSKNRFPLMVIDYIDTFIMSSTVNVQIYLKTFDKRINEFETMIKIICSLLYRLKKCGKFCMSSNIILKLNWVFMPEINRKLNLIWICGASKVNFKDIINLHKPLRKHKTVLKLKWIYSK